MVEQSIKLSSRETTIIEISRKNVEEEKPLSPVTTSELWEEN